MKEDLISIRNELKKEVEKQAAVILQQPVEDFPQYKHLLGIYYGLSRAAELVEHRIQATQDPNYDYTKD
jgi:hypothetical protein